MKIVLCSTSPRRVELIKLICDDVEIISPNFEEEKISGNIIPEEYAMSGALNKALSVADRTGDDIYISADTIVVTLDTQILGKPMDKTDAFNMLTQLSGNCHRVITGIAIIYKDIVIKDFSVTKVYFNELSQEETDEYIASGEPLDKAGAYGIQSGAAKFISRIEGCYFNVVGLPVSLVYDCIKRIKQA